jgi:uncharacterized protein YgfB (UPF0149 family)
MDIVMGWLSKIDVTTIVASAVTFLLGWAMVKVQLNKAISIMGELADLLYEIKKSTADGKLDKTEVDTILKEAQELIAEFKK